MIRNIYDAVYNNLIGGGAYVRIIKGCVFTLLVFALALCVACLFAAVLSFLRTSAYKGLRALGASISFLAKGTPLYLALLLWYYTFLGGMHRGGVLIAVLVFGIYGGGHLSDTKVELETGGYEVLRVHNPELPKLFMVSDLYRIFSGETLCMALEEIGVALFGIRPKDCYIMEQAIYEQLTEPVDGMRQFTSGGSVKETVKTALAHSLTTASLEEEMLYWESYLDVDKVVYTILPGTASAQEYRPNKAEIKRMVQNLQVGLFEENYEGQE